MAGVEVELMFSLEPDGKIGFLLPRLRATTLPFVRLRAPRRRPQLHRCSIARVEQQDGADDRESGYRAASRILVRTSTSC